MENKNEITEFNICWHVEYFDIERERPAEISTLDESSFIPSGRYQSIAAIKILPLNQRDTHVEGNLINIERAVVIMTSGAGQLTIAVTVE
jgi:hypothetical protein